MIQEECQPQVACEVIEKEQKLELTDPRTYCFNVSSKHGDVCLPKTCHVVKRGLARKSVEDEESENIIERTTLIPLKQPHTTCIPSKETGIKTFHEEEIRDGQEKIIHGSSGSKIATKGPQGKTGQVGIAEISPKSWEPTRVPLGRDDHLGTMKLSGARITASGGVTSSTSGKLNRETVSLARLMGISEGPAAIMAAFGNIESAKESLASLGAMSTAGAIMCDCCECDPCICGPRGLSIENIVVALKAMMCSGEDMHKLIAALGPGAMSALETVMAKEGKTAAGWATGGGMSKEQSLSENVRLDGATATSQIPVTAESQKALCEAWLRGDFDEMTSCHCLPGMCPCPGDHYLYREKKKYKDRKKKKRRIRKKIKKIGKDGKEYEEWDWVTPSESDGESRLSETCVCPPTKHFLTPESSETDVSARSEDTNKKIYWRDLMVCTCPKLQRTLIIIKPECIKFKDVVLRAVKSYGLDILAERHVQLSPEEASEVYAKYYGSSRFPNMVVSISQAPVTALSLGGIDVVRIWNHIIGPDGTLPGEWFLPDWISRKFGYFGEIVDALHGSKNLTNADRENRYFFPESFIDPLMKDETNVKDYIATNVNPTLLKGLALLAKEKPIDPIVFLAEWLLTHDPFQPRFPNNILLARV